MNDWVAGSVRMKSLVGASMSLWLAGILCALFAPVGDGALNSAAALMFVGAFGVSGPVVVWSALQMPRGSWLRVVWALVGAGLAVDVTAVVVVLVRNLSNSASVSPFEGVMSAAMLGYPLICGGLAYAAFSLRTVRDRAKAAARAAVMPIMAFGLFLFALIGPGPGMPFSVTTRDAAGIVRLFVDCFFVFAPAVYCVAATLELPDSHRSRSWLWLAVGGLMWAMSDTVLPLVDVRLGQFYPLGLWALGTHLMAVGASLTVDFERAETRL